MERYRAIYVWKIVQGLVPNCGLEVSSSERRGREIVISASKGSQRLKTLRDQSFQVNGAKIFNSLPKSIRNLNGTDIDEFKSKLDKYLELLPDEPKLENYTPTVCDQFSASPSNSIIDHSRARTRRPG